ncbi:transcription factor [Phlyctema vagabunda]|uniref:Transcription factor n=1 Tax=Phlyctema vagabunda TaxID=108571 RepID=A0ABR4PXF0_9HELO
MASRHEDDLLRGDDDLDNYASQSRWRHQESSSFARHAAPRQAEANHGDSRDLANFLNSTRVDGAPGSAGSGGNKHQPLMVSGNAYKSGSERIEQNEPHTLATEVKTNGDIEGLDVKCGPILNYRRMENETWFGSVLIVTQSIARSETELVPELRLRSRERPRGNAPELLPGSNGTEGANGTHGTVNGVEYANGYHDAEGLGHASNGAHANGASDVLSPPDMRIAGVKLYSDPVNTFWRFDLEVRMQAYELQCAYEIPGLNFSKGKKTDKNEFYVPAIAESMRIMFHSCNGFSVGTDEKAWSGPALWNDVQRVHKVTPFHVMLGGGDQIYNDGIRVSGPLRAWSDISNPTKRRHHLFPESLRKECDDYYVNNYIRWYSTEPFATANGQIPALQLWDDHDIIDGFGSYVHDFMECAVFRGIGGVANKYYLLFQHHLAPPVSTFTTDAPQIMSENGPSPDPRQLEATYVLENEKHDPSYIIGAKPGPYVADQSRSIYARLGARIAFFGLDARTERTRKQVNYPETYDIIFSRIREELGRAAASSSPIQHMIVLLGIPIAYPRLTWLENIFSSPLMGPLKFMNKRFGFGGGFFNKFDGSVDLLDDLDDHYTARTHKKERLFLMKQLQAIAAEFSVRVTILGGDVHLAAVGRFYSNPKLHIPVENDHRYMANIISSAIVNKPPPQAVANLLAKRNKLHHLDHDTDETLMKFFDRDPGETSKTANSNKVTMPSRNYAVITENSPASSNGVNGHQVNSDAPENSVPKAKDGHSWLHKGEVDAGTTHKAAISDSHGQGHDGSLDVCIRVEMDQHDPEGKARGYGLTIPTLAYNGAAEKTLQHQSSNVGTENENVRPTSGNHAA